MKNDCLTQPLIDAEAKILIRRGLFSLEPKTDFLRTLNRPEYYTVKSWLRSVRRQMMLEAEKEAAQ